MAMPKPFILLLFIGGFLITCNSSRQSAKQTTDQTNRVNRTENYTAAFPHSDVSARIKQVQQSIVRIVATGFYESYSFGSQPVTLADINTNGAENLATTSYSIEESTAGTAIILDQDNRHFLLIASEHVVSFPDTAIVYYEGKQYPPKRYIKTISIKRRQNNLIYTGQEIKSFDVISTDPRLDLALLDIELEKINNLDQYPLNIKFGNSSFMQLGSFMYILGFPKGYAMVTRGLASSSESWNDRFFVIDAVFNPGISGGPVLASRDNFKSLEWVGMVSSATASREDVLVPRPNSEKFSAITRPYSDTVFVEQKTRINYGIAQAVPINMIKEFLQANADEIKHHGFSLSKRLAPQ